MVKKKKTIWHKKKNKFIQPSSVKHQGKVDKTDEQDPSKEKPTRRKAFAKDFLAQIKKGVEKSKE